MILKQTNLEKNIFNKSKVLVNIKKIIENHTSVISSKNLNRAFDKVNEVKNMAGSAITAMAANMEQTEMLLANS